jgi:hypothetical protein
VEQNFGRFHGLNIIAGLEIRLTQDEIVVADETKTVYRHHTSLVRRTQFSIGHLDSAPVVKKNRQIVAVWHWTTVGDQFQAGGWGSTTSGLCAFSYCNTTNRAGYPAPPCLFGDTARDLPLRPLHGRQQRTRSIILCGVVAVRIRPPVNRRARAAGIFHAAPFFAGTVCDFPLFGVSAVPLYPALVGSPSEKITL